MQQTVDVYQELTPEIIQKIIQRKDTTVDGTAEGDCDNLDNEACPVGWVRRVVRMLLKSRVVPDVTLTMYNGLQAGPKLAVLMTEYHAANMSVLSMESSDFKVGLFTLNADATHSRLYGIVGANSAQLELWYYDWPW